MQKWGACDLKYVGKIYNDVMWRTFFDNAFMMRLKEEIIDQLMLPIYGFNDFIKTGGQIDFNIKDYVVSFDRKLYTGEEIDNLFVNYKEEDGRVGSSSSTSSRRTPDLPGELRFTIGTGEYESGKRNREYMKPVYSD